ncbi:MAG: tetratricopeptide repeat protein [Gemmatimonadales bacterium]
MRLPPLLQRALDRTHGPSDEPLRFLRITAGVLLLFGTLVAIALALWGIAPRALLLVGMFWAIYGFIVGLTSGILEPAIEGLSRMLADFGLVRVGGGYSAIETLVVRGHLDAAAEAYRERAERPRDRVEATVRRAALLAGPLAQPETALVELESLRRSPLSPADDLRVGAALVELYDRRLGDPGRAMAELRRLIDRYPDSRSARRLRHALAELKAEHLESR